MDLKYELLPETSIQIKKSTLYRIKALRSFSNIKKGDVGGYIEKESNLSHYGVCWIFDEAKVFEDAQVLDNARLFDEARVYGNAEIYGNAIIRQNAHVFDYARVFERAQVSYTARVGGRAIVDGNMKIIGDLDGKPERQEIAPLSDLKNRVKDIL
jgi:UDP-3-O-[3-hydroxymyristoyl] glucosamine N-acyltransferase